MDDSNEGCEVDVKSPQTNPRSCNSSTLSSLLGGTIWAVAAETDVSGLFVVTGEIQRSVSKSHSVSNNSLSGEIGSDIDSDL